MTKDDAGNLGTEVRRSHGNCLDGGDLLRLWMDSHREVAPEEARSVMSMAHGVPWPSIRGRKEGPFPVYPERPYFDARFHEGTERGETIVDPCGHERSKA